ncbi:protein of unknown function (DUF3007) [Rubidibacter lacunae KORDI 51-2]|uniref:DUF3007 family protein n=1 Tax=Rubidibacter lacunae KORDI 51-2 TaxID=582515 RepID=U5DFZ7_9CHRO|nr:DUF3007 family protein [Rubidibacter lacunae]ERN40182.1 protein of unknown function (DUF3007) [Rubidibacter lacunae KORDI 51-2]
MRRIDAIAIALGVLIAGLGSYWLLQATGLDSLQAGIWSQVLLVGGLVGWLLSYGLRVVTHNMTYHQQLDEYEEAVLQKRIDELSPEELLRLQAEVAAEQQAQAPLDGGTGDKRPPGPPGAPESLH